MLKYHTPADLDRTPVFEIKCFLKEEFDSTCLRERDDRIVQPFSLNRIDEEESLGLYAYLDSTDCDVVAELVGALQTNDLLAIHEGEHSY